MRSAAAGLALIGLSAVGFALYVNEFSETGRAFGGLVLLGAWAAFAAGVGLVAVPAASRLLRRPHA